MQAIDLWEIEEQLWTSGADFYEEHLDPGAVLVSSTYGALNRDAVLALVRHRRCAERAILDDREHLCPSGDVAVLAYNVHAIKPTGEHHARCKSTYVRVDGKWKLALHHQTKVAPLEEEATESLSSTAFKAAVRALRPIRDRIQH